MNQKWLVTFFFFGLLIVLLYLAFLVLSPFIQAITWAAIMAIVVYPAYLWLLNMLKGRSTVTALIITILITFVIVFPAMRISVFLSQEAVELTKTVHTYVNGQGIESWKEVALVKDILKLWEGLSRNLALANIDPSKTILQGVQITSKFLASQVTNVAQNIFIFAFNLIIALISFFFLLRDGKGFCERTRSLLPMDHERQEHLFQKIVNALFAVIHGALLTAVIQGFLAGVAFWFLGVPFAILLGASTALTALFPLGGSVAIWLPTVFYLFLQGTYLKAIILLVWGAGIVSSIDNVLKPLLMGSRMKLPTLFLFFSIFGGLKLFGIIGIILGPVLFALLVELLDLYMKEYVEA